MEEADGRLGLLLQLLLHARIDVKQNLEPLQDGPLLRKRQTRHCTQAHDAQAHTHTRRQVQTHNETQEDSGTEVSRRGFGLCCTEASRRHDG
jgi:hypothetical protein